MKKILLGMMAVAMLASCNPTEKSFDMNAKSYSSDDLSNIVTFIQTDENGNVQTDGNYFTYTTNPATVVSIIALRADGSENILATGATGSFTYAPSRGSDPQQTFYIRALNADGTTSTGETTVTVYVPGELEPAVKVLASDVYGSKVWKWDTSVSGTCWGNMGYCGGKGSDVGLAGNGQWWGVASEEEFLTQEKHAADGFIGDESMDATMVIGDDGTIKCYDATGNQIRSGSFTVENYDPSDPDAWKVGNLVTTAGAILWPYQINWKDNGFDPYPTTFEICYLTADKMTLVYPDGGDFGALGNWGEATYWHFTSTTDQTGMVAGYDNGKDWTWDTSVSGTCWGNMGYCGGNGSDVGTTGNGQWWGVASEEEFLTQEKHAADGFIGDESMDAYMTFSPDGLISSYDASGTQIRKGTFELETIADNTWKVANLNTTPGAILWPYQINWKDNGFDAYPTTFEVVYLTSDKMTLVYPDGGDFGALGNWGEATYWHFKAK